MLRQVAEGVLIHQSELLQNNAVVVQGRAGVLLIDPGITGDEIACLANDLREATDREAAEPESSAPHAPDLPLSTPEETRTLA